MRRLVIAAIFAGIVVLLAVGLLSAWPPLIFSERPAAATAPDRLESSQRPSDATVPHC